MSSILARSAGAPRLLKIVRMSPAIRRIPTWKELYGHRASLQAVTQLLSGLNLPKTVLLLAEINILLALDRFHNESRESQSLQGFLISNFIDDDLFSKLKERYGTERVDVRRCFHQWQILTLLKWAILHCPPERGLASQRKDG